MEHDLERRLQRQHKPGVGARLDRLEQLAAAAQLQARTREPGDGPLLWPGHCPACGADMDEQPAYVVCNKCFDVALDARCMVLLGECDR